jgi:hypothetical protein
MQELIASYLFQEKSTSLPGIGSLTLHNSGAVTDFTNKKILAPHPVIHFENNETGSGSLLEFISKKNNCNLPEAAADLDSFCVHLKKEMASDSGAKLEGVGDLFINPAGEIVFRQVEIPSEFLQPVQADWVIHQASEHAMRVGDKEVTNTEMSEYYNLEPAAKEHWWIWAIILGIAGIAAILIYLGDANAPGIFGNAVKF